MKQSAVLATAALCAWVSIAFSGCSRPLPDDVAAQPEVTAKLRAALAGTGSAAPETDATASAEPTGFVDLSGVFRIAGTPPAMEPLPISGNDAGYCTQGGKVPMNQRVEVGPNGGLANVLIFIDMKLKPSWEHPDYAASREAKLTGPDAFDQKNCIFLSHVFAMRSTQAVEILNSDAVPHNTNIAAKGRARVTNNVIPAMSSAEYAPGGPSGVPFEVTCNIHPWMRAYMYVCDHPYFAVTDHEGKFTMPKVPAGVELSFKVWKEANPNNWDGTTLNGSGVNWSRGKFKVTLPPDSPANWEVVVDASSLQ